MLKLNKKNRILLINLGASYNCHWQKHVIRLRVYDKKTWIGNSINISIIFCKKKLTPKLNNIFPIKKYILKFMDLLSYSLTTYRKFEKTVTVFIPMKWRQGFVSLGETGAILLAKDWRDWKFARFSWWLDSALLSMA